MSFELRPNLSNKEHHKTKYLSDKINLNLNNLFKESKTLKSNPVLEENKILQKKYRFIDNLIKNYFKYIGSLNNTIEGYTSDEYSSDEEEYFDDYLSN